MTRTVTVVNQLGMHARAAAKFVHLATRFQSRVLVSRDAREMDGKSIMGILLLAAARRVGHRHQRGRRRRGRRGGRAFGAGVVRIRRGHVRRLTGIGVSPGIVSGRAVIFDSSARRCCGIRSRRPGSSTRSRGSTPAATRSRAQLTEIGRRVARRRGPELASLFDAQLLMLDDPMLVPRAAEILRGQRVNAECEVQQVYDEFSAVFD